MKILTSWVEDGLHLFYPHLCTGCGTDLIEKYNLLCYQCIEDLPKTQFEHINNNPVEKLFFGRINIAAAYSEFYFSKGHTLQHLIHELKYKGNTDIGYYLGELMGQSLKNSNRFSSIDIIIPLPMYRDKEIKRGYNQATILSKGISNVLQIPVDEKSVSRSKATTTQTRKDRTERWLNVDQSFIINNTKAIEGKSILLVDDVITTGATLEACGNLILQIPNTQLSIATLAQAVK
jgi:ComF family protein